MCTYVHTKGKTGMQIKDMREKSGCWSLFPFLISSLMMCFTWAIHLKKHLQLMMAVDTGVVDMHCCVSLIL